MDDTTKFKEIHSLDEFESIKQNSNACMFYFSHKACGVCSVLKPKVEELIQTDFPLLQLYYVDINLSPEIAGQASVFTVPTLAVYFDSKELIRKSRNVGLRELAQAIERPYKLLFE